MLIDLTTVVTPEIQKEMQVNEDRLKFGHLGTHFDALDKEFELHYAFLPGVAFDVTNARGREIIAEDIDLAIVEKGMFVALYTGFIEEQGYGGDRYFEEHPQLSWELLDKLLTKQIAILGVDCAGVRHDPEHKTADRKYADNGAFVVENLCNLAALLRGKASARFEAVTLPIKFTGMTGLPCRVLARVE